MVPPAVVREFARMFTIMLSLLYTPARAVYTTPHAFIQDASITFEILMDAICMDMGIPSLTRGLNTSGSSETLQFKVKTELFLMSVKIYYGHYEGESLAYDSGKGCSCSAHMKISNEPDIKDYIEHSSYSYKDAGLL